MTKNRKIKTRINYEENTPQCANCAHHKPAGYKLVNSIPRWWNEKCGVYGFVTKPHALCDTWRGRDGSTLEKA